MMTQVILHVRMVFLAYVLTQLLLADDSISVGEMQIHLRSLHCLYQPYEAPKLVSMQEDGTLLPITLAEAIKPVRTYIPSMMDTYIPKIDTYEEGITAAKEAADCTVIAADPSR
jgi:hypothetical protein